MTGETTRHPTIHWLEDLDPILMLLNRWTTYCGLRIERRRGHNGLFAVVVERDDGTRTFATEGSLETCCAYVLAVRGGMTPVAAGEAPPADEKWTAPLADPPPETARCRRCAHPYVQHYVSSAGKAMCLNVPSRCSCTCWVWP